MDEKFKQQPEGKLIEQAMKRRRPKISIRKASTLADISESYWRQIVKGSRSASKDYSVPIIAPALPLARMAKVAGVTPEQLTEAQRHDAAIELKEMLKEEQMLKTELSSKTPLGAYSTKELLEELLRRDAVTQEFSPLPPSPPKNLYLAPQSEEPDALDSESIEVKIPDDPWQDYDATKRTTPEEDAAHSREHKHPSRGQNALPPK